MSKPLQFPPIPPYHVKFTLKRENLSLQKISFGKNILPYLSKNDTLKKKKRAPKVNPVGLNERMNATETKGSNSKRKLQESMNWIRRSSKFLLGLPVEGKLQ